MSSEVYVHATVDLDEIDVTELTEYLESANYKVFSDDSDGAQEALEWVQEEWEGLINDDAANDVLAIVNEHGIDYVLDCIKQDELLAYMHRTFTPDQIMGPIESTNVINHLEQSIAAMVIRKMEDPTEEMCKVFINYLANFGYLDKFFAECRRAGVPLEFIIHTYVTYMMKDKFTNQ